MAKPTGYRPERSGESSEVRDVVRAAFGDEEGVERIVDALRTSDAWLGLSYVAEDASGLVGHVAFTRSLLDAPDRLVDVLVLSPLSVLPRRQGQGVGSELVRYALAELEGRPEPLVFLEGGPDFYSRLGFIAGKELGFSAPSVRIPPPAFQVATLPGYDQTWMSGAVVYPDVWWRQNAVGLRPER